MDYIQSSNKQVDKFGPGAHGFSAGNPTGGEPATFYTPDWADSVQQEHINTIKAGGLVPSGASLSQAAQSIRRIAGGNMTVVNAANSPYVLTADNAGVVIMDATAGNIAATLPAANVLAGLPYVFRRTDATANTVTVNRAGADTIDEGGVSFTLTSKAVQQVRSNGVTTWSTVTHVAATQAETDAGTDDAKFITPKKLRYGFSILLAANGFIAFPSWLGGVIFQWGAGAISNAGSAFTFPLAFPAACYGVFPEIDDSAPSSRVVNVVNGSISLTGVQLTTNVTGGGKYFAIGK